MVGTSELEIGNPSQQGLKLYSELLITQLLFLEIGNPSQQGLKHIPFDLTVQKVKSLK